LLDQLIVHEFQGLFKKFIHIYLFELQGRWLGKLEKFVNEPVDPIDFPADDPGKFLKKLFIIEFLRQIFAKSFYSCQRIFYFVRHSRSQSRHALHLLRLNDLLTQ